MGGFRVQEAPGPRQGRKKTGVTGPRDENEVNEAKKVREARQDSERFFRP